ncbi:MAG TPA: GlsB/YeaQ/YmgE family stress response membrane protein [Alphaproteobacteria bacterium]|jgi:LPXTG-motif cell wall-anchored protein
MSTLIDAAYLLLIGLVAGFLAATLLGERRRYGVIGYLVVGVIGAIGGNYVFGSLQLPNTGTEWRLIAGVVGAIVLILLLRLLRR